MVTEDRILFTSNGGLVSIGKELEGNFWDEGNVVI